MTYKIGQGADSLVTWQEEFWNARLQPSSHKLYTEVIAALQALAERFNIQTSVDGCSFTPVHFIFFRYINEPTMAEALI